MINMDSRVLHRQGESSEMPAMRTMAQRHKVVSFQETQKNKAQIRTCPLKYERFYRWCPSLFYRINSS